MYFINEKNITPQRLALWCALFISGIILVILVIAEFFWQYLLLDLAIVFIAAYLVVYYTIERFFYRKIKSLNIEFENKFWSGEDLNNLFNEDNSDLA